MYTQIFSGVSSEKKTILFLGIPPGGWDFQANLNFSFFHKASSKKAMHLCSEATSVLRKSGSSIIII